MAPQAPQGLIQCLREGRPTDMNVYDAAALSAVDFPDFTRGRWRANPKLQIDSRLMATTSGN